MNRDEKIHDRDFRKILYVDMDGVLADFEGKVRKLLPDAPAIDHPEWSDWVDRVEKIPGFYRDLQPIDGAIESFVELSKAYDIYILSTPSWDNPSCWTDKRLWVEEHLGHAAYKRIILTHDKGLFKGRALIDDRTKNGVLNFDGEHIHFATTEFPTWNEVTNHLMQVDYNEEIIKHAFTAKYSQMQFDEVVSNLKLFNYPRLQELVTKHHPNDSKFFF